MARKLSGLSFALISGALAASSLAQATPAATPDKAAKRPGLFGRRPPESPEIENVRKAIDALTPEQRKRFQENFWRWANLSPEEKKALRDREEIRKKFMQEEVAAALQESGLELSDDRRELFARRYAEERRKIEEQLRKEMNEKRRPLVREMLDKLRAEFSPNATPATAEQAKP